MSTSGTVGQTQIEIATLIEHIVRRCGLTASTISPEIIQSMKNVIFMFCTSLSNRGINLWRVQRGLFGLTPDQATYVLPAGTLDVLQANYRVPVKLGGVVSAGSALTDGDRDTIYTQVGGSLSWTFPQKQSVSLVGLLAGATGTNRLTFEVSNDGGTWTAVRTPGDTAMTDGRWKWFNIEPALAGTYFRIRETNSNTFVLRDVTVCQEWRETLMYRMNRDDFANLPSKRTTGEPRQFWLDRQSTPQMVAWPTPSTAASFNLVSLWSHMQLQDIGQISNTLDIPQRWYDAVVANCAYMALLDLPAADIKRYDMLKDQADRTMTVAESEERDNSATNWQPNISAYTA